jgi:predicted dehydrogenase
MDKGNLSRRGFMERSLAAFVGAGLPLWYAREMAEGQLRAADETKKVGDVIRIGLVGCGGQGRGVMKGMKSNKGVKVVAVCDVDAKRRAETIAKDFKAEEKPEDIKQFEDFRQLNDLKDLDAVIVGTVDHWHTLVSIDAMKKGKDVYCEKPLTLTVDEGKKLVKVAKETKAIFQVGSQQRSDARFRLGAELARNGRLGKLRIVEARIGDNPQGGPFKESPVPEGLNWDFWQGQTPAVPYIKQRCHYEFRWWYEYSGGKMTDWGAHHLDQAQWALGTDETGPVSVESLATEPSRVPNSYNCHHKFLVTYGYANGTKLLCSDRQLPNSFETRHDNGVLYVGENNQWIFVNRAVIIASDQAERSQEGKPSKGIPHRRGGPSKLLDEPLGKDAVRLYKSDNHYRNWLDGIRTRKPCVCTAEVGHRSVTVCHLGAIALRLGGKRMEWDPAEEKFVRGNAEAGNKMLSRPMRGEWQEMFNQA